MITTETTCAITCDKCGKTIEIGKTWYQVAHNVSSAVFDGTASSTSLQGGPTLLQLCADDYAGNVAKLEAIAAPIAQLGAADTVAPPL